MNSPNRRSSSISAFGGPFIVWYTPYTLRSPFTSALAPTADGSGLDGEAALYIGSADFTPWKKAFSEAGRHFAGSLPDNTRESPLRTVRAGNRGRLHQQNSPGLLLARRRKVCKSSYLLALELAAEWTMQRPRRTSTDLESCTCASRTLAITRRKARRRRSLRYAAPPLPYPEHV